MDLQKVLYSFEKNNMNQLVWFYMKDRKLHNICFQNNIFFKVVQNRRICILNPLRIMDELEKIKNKELRLVAYGNYLNAIDFNKSYNPWERKSWKAL